MAALTPEYRQRLLNSTKRAAAALMADLEHMREVVLKPHPTRDDIRWLSVYLRRILVEGVLKAVVAPRIGRFTLHAPDNRQIYEKAKKNPYLLFVSGGGSAHVPSFRLEIDDDGENVRKFTQYKISELIEMKLDNFLAQRVLYFHGTWISRRDVIKYVSNIDSGVHSGHPKEPSDAVLDKIAQSIILRASPSGAYTAYTTVDVLLPEETEFRFDPTAIGIVQLELLSAAFFLVSSKSTYILMSILIEEFIDH